MFVSDQINKLVDLLRKFEENYSNPLLEIVPLPYYSKPCKSHALIA